MQALPSEQNGLQNPVTKWAMLDHIDLCLTQTLGMCSNPIHNICACRQFQPIRGSMAGPPCSMGWRECWENVCRQAQDPSSMQKFVFLYICRSLTSSLSILLALVEHGHLEEYASEYPVLGTNNKGRPLYSFRGSQRHLPDHWRAVASKSLVSWFIPVKNYVVFSNLWGFHESWPITFPAAHEQYWVNLWLTNSRETYLEVSSTRINLG